MFCQADSVGMLCLLRPCNYKSEMVGWTIQALPTGHCLKATKNGSSTAIKISSTVAEAFSLLRRCDSDRQAAIAKLCLFNIWTECPSWGPYLPSSLVLCVCSQDMVCAHCSLLTAHSTTIPRTNWSLSPQVARHCVFPAVRLSDRYNNCWWFHGSPESPDLLLQSLQWPCDR